MKCSPSAVLLFLCCLAVWLSTGHTASSLETLALRRGVSMGNMLEAPNEGDWGLYVQECPPSALVGQIRQIEEGSVSGSS